MHTDGSKYSKFQVKSIYYLLCIRPIVARQQLVLDMLLSINLSRANGTISAFLMNLGQLCMKKKNQKDLYYFVQCCSVTEIQMHLLTLCYNVIQFDSLVTRGD